MIIRLRAARAPLLSAVFILALTDTTVARADVPTPKPWMGEMDPTSRSCPKLNRDRGEPFVYHCVRASIGVIENTEPFAPGPYEDKEDPDWAKIAPYFRTGKLLYIQSEDCDDGVSAFMARGGAQQNSSIAENEAEKKFNRALQEKFRELTFRKKDFALHCVAIEGEGEDVLISAQAAPAAATSDDNNDDDTPDDTSSATSSESDAASESAASDTMPDGIARFVITSKDRQSVGLRFFSQSRKHSWPGDDKYWTLSHGDERTYDLKCQPGEKICYGAWREDYADVAWGAAKYGKSGCERCCTVCGKRIERNLVDGGATPSNRLVFVVHNNDRYKLGIEFYSQTRQRIAWPGGNKQSILVQKACIL